MDCTVHGILQTRIPEWAAFPFSRGSSQPRDQTQVSHIAGGFFTSWAPKEAQKYWSGQPILSPAVLPDPGNKLWSPALQAYSLPTELWGKPLHILNFLLCCSWLISCVWLFSTLVTVAHQTPLSMVFSRQDYWSGLSCPSLENLPIPGFKPRCSTLQADSLPTEPPRKPIFSVSVQYFSFITSVIAILNFF